jgi:hypothetical protein
VSARPAHLATSTLAALLYCFRTTQCGPIINKRYTEPFDCWLTFFTRLQGTELHPAERALCEIALMVFPIFFINVLYMFMVAQMLYPYRHLRRANKNATGVATDLVSVCSEELSPADSQVQHCKKPTQFSSSLLVETV